MAYSAVSGGEEAIEASIQLLDYYRSGTDKDIELESVTEKFGLLIDKVMSEARALCKVLCRPGLKTMRRLYRRSGFSASCIPFYIETQSLHSACKY